MYRRGSNDQSPVVMEKYKLVFFTIPKVGCTQWKQLFRRAMGFANWKQERPTAIVHKPSVNGLKYLFDYPLEEAHHFLTSPDWTRAVFLRDPKERVLSAYLDKAARTGSDWLLHNCCRHRRDCAVASFHEFLTLAETCRNDHWTPQYAAIPKEIWPYINFVGKLDNASVDARTLLKRIGMWEEFGAWGWGTTNSSIFTKETASRHATSAGDFLRQHYTPEIEKRVEQMYSEDFSILNLKNKSIF